MTGGNRDIDKVQIAQALERHESFRFSAKINGRLGRFGDDVDFTISQRYFELFWNTFPAGARNYDK